MPRSKENIDKVKSRHWCFTLNNPEGGAELYETKEWNQYPVEFMIVGLEHAPTTGTPHHQGYVHWPNPRYGASMRKLLPTARWAACKGSERDNEIYCSKEANIIVRVGETGTTHSDEEQEESQDEIKKPARQGKRTDISRARQWIDEGQNWRYIVSYVTSFSALRLAAEYLSVAEPPRQWKTHVTWIFGPTGTGKTHLANQLCKSSPWISGQTLKWFDGYDAHTDAIVDEFRGDFCPFHELLRLTDALALRVEIKRGTRQWKPRRLFITSCYPPHRVYKDRTTEDLRQLGRRIETVIWIPRRGEAFHAPGSELPGESGAPWVPKQPFELPKVTQDWMTWLLPNEEEEGNNETEVSPLPQEDNVDQYDYEEEPTNELLDEYGL